MLFDLDGDEWDFQTLMEGETQAGSTTQTTRRAMEPPPSDIQLVACMQQSGLVSDDGIAVCNYFNEDGNPADPADSYRITYFQGRYRIDIYETRTGTAVENFTVSGADDGPFCASTSYRSDEDTDAEERVTRPGEDEYEPMLQDLVAGPAR